MPRQGRIDYPGALLHLMGRGIEKRNIFRDDRDRKVFITRLAKALQETKALCYAWALMPNHFHLLLIRGEKPVGRVMQSLQTSYAVYFNKRHERSGHLFQNRFKSVLVEREPYLLELIRYIHLNPLRAKVVSSLEELALYPWSGHAEILGVRSPLIQPVDAVMGLFGSSLGEARRNYTDFVAQGASQGRRLDLSGGGVVRCEGGWEEVYASKKRGDPKIGDERILGSGDFVKNVLREAEAAEQRGATLRRQGLTAIEIMSLAAKQEQISLEELSNGRKLTAVSRARALACAWLIDQLGLSGAETGRQLGITTAAALRAADRGRQCKVPFPG